MAEIEFSASSRACHKGRNRSWDGIVKENLTGAAMIKDGSGFGIDRDVNGARDLPAGFGK